MQIYKEYLQRNSRMDINIEYDPSKPTLLCEIMEKYGSDKGAKNNNGWHNYTTYYSRLFEPIRLCKFRVFELGLGTNNVSLPSNMGANGKPGASLRGWAEFFPHSEIFGADIDKDILFEDDRIKTFYCDQTNPASIKQMWEIPTLHDQLDIIIEDGLHEFHANKCFFENSCHKLNIGGVFIIEDILLNKYMDYVKLIEDWRLSYPNFQFEIIIIPHGRNKIDNVLIAAMRII